MSEITAKTSKHELTLQWSESPEDKGVEASLAATQAEPGVDLVHIHISIQVPTPMKPPVCTLSWSYPLVDIHAFWRSGGDHNKGLVPAFARKLTTNATFQAPVCCLHSFSGQNRLTFAFSDALHTLQIMAGVHEETATLHCSIDLFTEPSPLQGSYEATLRLDTRAIPYYESLEQVQMWWVRQSGYEPAFVPEIARLPMYSTWYSLHQHVEAAQVEEQCRLAKALGCEAVIVDDGWQTSDNARGYAYTGDWAVTHDKIPDMRAHVARIHALGMKYILWYSVPFVGVQSAMYTKFAGKLLYEVPRLGAGVLDPRFPDVREHIIATYEQAMRSWDLDGFKLDFVDSFTESSSQERQPAEGAEGQDYLSVSEAVNRLFTDCIVRLRSIKSDVMIEFRQAYVGPLMRKYGNMFRAADCPNDALTNRERTLDIRLLCGRTAAHSDMLMWHKDEPVESAALQIINILFSVPQISVLLDSLPARHLAMLRYWLGFWREHRDVLLDGRLMPLHPETHYPLVIATTGQKRIAVVYQDTIVNAGPDLPTTLIVINGTREERVALELENAGQRQLTIRDCQGQLISEEHVDLGNELHRIAVPAAGTLTLTR